ncbi:hypothetical protein [Bartonella harrusi]|uniref:Uncharacterized protein n=1 Tax=Bartonella harrusi TaxID=2961895 RepID=A0ABY5ES60_9HYPH|nr:hypothetical protein [Bartonella harrusi]UTO28107.1 hypothetical protein NMK50_07900 [Bartonella harrusi]
MNKKAAYDGVGLYLDKRKDGGVRGFYAILFTSGVVKCQHDFSVSLPLREEKKQPFLSTHHHFETFLAFPGKVSKSASARDCSS